MQKLSIALLTLLALALPACKKKSGGDGDMMGKMTELKNKMCECKAGDKACADTVNEEMKKWHAKPAGKEATPDPEMARKMEPINREFGECMTKAMTPVGGAGSAPATDTGSAMGSGHGSMDHGSARPQGGSADHGSMDHGSAHPHGSAK